jgi:AcrR family transcriptional regulator
MTVPGSSEASHAKRRDEMATQVKVNPSDPRVKRTRQLLKQSLADLLSKRPFHELTVQDIADRATLNRVTFYAHFDDKYDLFSSWIRDEFVSRLEAQLPSSSDLSATNLRLLCRVVLQSLLDTQTHCRPVHDRYTPLFESAVQEALYAFVLDWLRHSSVEEPLRDVSAETLAAAMSWMIFGAGIDWSRSAESRPLDKFVDELVIILLRGASEVFVEEKLSDHRVSPS